MMNLEILNSKKIKELHLKLKEQFGFDNKLDYVFLKSKKGRIYIVTKEIQKVKYDEFRMDTLGNYFASEEKDDIRLSIEGSQLIGPDAKKNVLELNDEKFKQWFKGEDVEVKDEQGFQIIKHNDDFVGCGKAGNGILRNFIPKTRRITSEML